MTFWTSQFRLTVALLGFAFVGYGGPSYTWPAFVVPERKDVGMFVVDPRHLIDAVANDRLQGFLQTCARVALTERRLAWRR